MRFGLMLNRIVRALPPVLTIVIFVASASGQGTAIEPCQASPSPSKPAISSPSVNPAKASTRARESIVDSSVAEDPAVEGIIRPYSEKVRALNVVIGRLDGELKKTGIGAGTLGNFVTDGMSAQAKAKLGKPVSLAIMNAGGLRKNEISSGQLRASDIFELLPFENALVAVDLNGAQLSRLLQIMTRDAQAGAHIQFKWNEQNRVEFRSGKLVDENGREREIDPQEIYTIVTIDYLLKLGSGSYAVLQEARNTTSLNTTVRDAIMDYVKAETAAGRAIRPRSDQRFVQVGPGPTRSESPE
jgi:2',3'-cyclic-nucleotide 2'-phosphodiesterase (5'-nucleotidase family)